MKVRKVGNNVCERFVVSEIDGFNLQRLHEALGFGVVIRVATPAHGTAQAVGCQELAVRLSSVLRPAVRMMDASDTDLGDLLNDPCVLRLLPALERRPSEVHEFASSLDGEATGPVTIDVIAPLCNGVLRKTPLKNSSSMVSLPTIRSNSAILISCADRRGIGMKSGSYSPAWYLATQMRIRFRATSCLRPSALSDAPARYSWAT